MTYYYYALPQRGPGTDGQLLGVPAPGGGVLPPGSPPPQPGLPAGIVIGGASMAPPWIDPPAGAIYLKQSAYAVVTVPTGGNSDAIAGATQLAAAVSANTGTTVSTVQQSATGTPVAILTYQATTYGVFNRFGVHVAGSQGRQSIAVQIQVNGNTSPGLPETPADSLDPIDAPGNIYVPFQPNNVVTVMVRNLDSNSGYLTRVVLRGWRY